MQEGAESRHFLQLEEKCILMLFALSTAAQKPPDRAALAVSAEEGDPAPTLRSLQGSRGDRDHRVPTPLLAEVREMFSMVRSPKKPSDTCSVMSHTSVLVNPLGVTTISLVRRQSRETSRVTLVGFRWGFGQPYLPVSI